MKTSNIVMVDRSGSHKTGTLYNVSKRHIVDVLGEANVDDDPSKVRYSWGFEVDGVFCAIWDWKGSGDQMIWSTFGPQDVIQSLFNQGE